jgi:hypothetical protein
MSIAVSALEAPTQDSLEEWLNTPRLARCGEFFTPSKPVWWPDRSANVSVKWQAAIACVPPAWQGWLHAALAFRMGESAQGTISVVTSILSRAAQVRLNPLNEDHLIDLRERFSMSEFSALAGFMKFWQQCESLEKRPSQVLIDAYDAIPRKKRSKHDVILSLDPELGPFTQAEQDALYHWAHEQFCHGNLDPERYLYLRLLMIYGQRGAQLRMIVFDDFIKTERGYQIRLFWAKQRGDAGGWRAKPEIFILDEDFYNIVQAYQSIVLARLEEEYPGQANWNKAIKHLPLFRRKLGQRGGRYKLFPVLADLPDQNILEQAPQAKFHASDSAIRSWMREMETMPDFPISSRTHQPLKISKGRKRSFHDVLPPC